jgi:hypothetical protein
MGAAEDVECLLEIAIVRQRSPITGKKRLVIGMKERGLFEYGDRLRALSRGSERRPILQRRFGVLGVGAIAIAKRVHLTPGVRGVVRFGFAQRPRDVRCAVGLAAAKPQRQSR